MTNCVGCGKGIAPGERRVLRSDATSVIMNPLRSFLCKRLNLADDSDLDSMLKKSFICMKCFTAYNTYVKKGKELYDRTADSTNFISYWKFSHRL